MTDNGVSDEKAEMPPVDPDGTTPFDPEQLAHRRDRTRWQRVRRRIFQGMAILGAVSLLFVIWVGYQLWSAWSRIERFDFDPAATREQIAAAGTTIPDAHFEDDAPAAFDDIELPMTTTVAATATTMVRAVYPENSPDVVGPEIPTTTTMVGLPPPPSSAARGDLSGYLVGGSDGSPSVGSADVIYLAVRGGGGTVFFIIPRSLYLNNPCTGSPTRAALLLRGCPGVASGTSLLTVALEDFTGINIKGFAVVGYSGFPRITDALGGIEICSDTPRGEGGRVIVPAGCNVLDGAAATWWVRSRSQDELVDGEWRAVAGDDETSRSERQAVALAAVIAKVRSFSSVGALVSVANAVPDTFALGGISLTEAASLAHSTRNGYSIASVPTHSEVTPDGTYVLYPNEPFGSTLARYGL